MSRLAAVKEGRERKRERERERERKVGGDRDPERRRGRIGGKENNNFSEYNCLDTD